VKAKKHPIKRRVVALDRDTTAPRRAAPATSKIPGSKDKLSVLAERARQGQSLFTEADAVTNESEHLTWEMRRNHTLVPVGTEKSGLAEKVHTSHPPSSLGEHIQAARKKANISRKQLERRAGLSKSCVSMIERDLRTPGINVLTAIADVLGLSLDTLVGRTPPS